MVERKMIWYKDTNYHVLRLNRVAVDCICLPQRRIEGRVFVDVYPKMPTAATQDERTVMNTREPRLGIIELYRLPTGEQR